MSAQEVISAVEALNALDLADSDSLYWGLRMAMVRSSEDLPVFDRVFREYWHRVMPQGEEEQTSDQSDGKGGPPPPPPGGEEDRTEAGNGNTVTVSLEDGGADDDATVDRAPFSAHEILRRKDFADYDDSDYERLAALLSEARFQGPWRLSRRKQFHKKGLMDIRRTIRAGFRTGGHPVKRVYRRRRSKHRRLTVVCDVSGSMERYSKALLQLAYVAAKGRHHVDAFAFATRLTRLTDELESHEPAEAMAAAASKVVDWSGGTRIGACLADLNRNYRSTVRGAVVVIASDGWDLGDPGELAREADLVHRLGHTVIWVNPHLQDPEFEPLTRGMSAALPFVDEFVSCHNFESFATLFSLLERT